MTTKRKRPKKTMPIAICIWKWRILIQFHIPLMQKINSRTMELFTNILSNSSTLLKYFTQIPPEDLISTWGLRCLFLSICQPPPPNSTKLLIDSHAKTREFIYFYPHPRPHIHWASTEMTEGRHPFLPSPPLLPLHKPDLLSEVVLEYLT